jgi:anthranilate phosphoribosyltransferase
MSAVRSVTASFVKVSAVDEKRRSVPETFDLLPNFPNPFNPTTVIGFQLPAARVVHLVVLDLLGQRVATLVEGKQEAGYHEVTFDASRLSSGIYLYRLQAGDFIRTRRLLLVK